MKKAKLFMMLALLVMGVGNAWGDEATRIYDVVYVGLPEGESGDYTINGYYQNPSRFNPNTMGIDASSTPDKIVMKYGSRNGTPTITNLTPNNYSNYFRPKTITNYNYSVSIDAVPNGDTAGKITISYTWNGNNYVDGDYIYSTKYWQSGQSSNTIDMPEGEVAVALNLKFNDTVTEQYVDYSWGDGYTIKERQIVTKTSHVVNAVIPASVTIGGKPYKVTAIQKLGFTYAQHYIEDLENCNDRISNPRTDEEKEKDGIYGSQVWDTENNVDDVSYLTDNDHSNWWLESVEFEAPENIKWIGDYAFQSCTKLKSIIIPKNVVYLGTGVCSTCPVLDDVRFQVDDDTHKTKIETLKMGSFYLCKSIKSLELPDGIKVIEGAGTSNKTFGPLQYLRSLTLIRLPNTLTTIGSHFLCCASSLKEVTIPASVTTFDGAAFHGCEALESVYLLGPASSIAANAGTGSATFGENFTNCVEHVSGCTFYTTPDYLESYQRHPVWSLIDEKGKDDGTQNTDNTYNTVYCNYANTLKALEPENRTFTGGKWVTAIFPDGVKNYKTEFGSKTRVARPDRRDDHKPTHSFENGYRMYNVTFQLISGDDIPAGVPVMFCPENTKTWPMITAESYARPGFKEDMKKDHIVDPLTADDGAKINMGGQYIEHTLMPWDFYFMYKKKTVNDDGSVTYTDPKEVAKFYRVTDTSIQVSMGATRCFWHINVDGVKTNAQMAPAKSARFFFDDETTGIKNVETKIALEGIYDLNGRKLDINPEDLPQGMFIVNGKKVLKK